MSLPSSSSAEAKSAILVNSIGAFGRWQMSKILALSMANVILAWHYLAYPLLSPTDKAFTCQNQTTTPEDPHQVCGGGLDNDSAVCQHFVFQDDGGFLSLQQDFQLVCHRSGLLSVRQLVFFMGMLVGCLTTGYLSDKFGRKPVLMVLMAIWSASSLLHPVVPSGSFSLFLTLQFMLSFAAQSSWTISWIWIIEILGHDKYRVLISLSTLYGWALGFISLPGIVYLCSSWRTAFLVMSVPTLLFPAYYWILPESPVWLMSHHRLPEAQAILNEAARCNNLPAPDDLEAVFKHIRAQDDDDDPGNFDVSRKTKCGDSLMHRWLPLDSFANIFRSRIIALRTLIFFYVYFVCSFMYYGLSLNSGDLVGKGQLFLTFTLYGVMEIPALIFATVSVLILGRRLPTLLLVLFSGLACLACFIIPQLFPDGSKVAGSVMVLAILGKLCITACFHTIFIYASEIYATPVRNTGLSTCSVFARIGGMVAPFVADLQSVDAMLPMAIFGVSGLLAAVLITFLPETKGAHLPHTLEESERLGQGQGWCCSQGRRHQLVPLDDLQAEQ